MATFTSNLLMILGKRMLPKVAKDLCYTDIIVKLFLINHK